MNQETGGPAFPRNILDHGHGVTSTHAPGMPLRDYFAAKAMQGFAADPSWDAYAEGVAKRVANTAYLWADAMLKEREK